MPCDESYPRHPAIRALSPADAHALIALALFDRDRGLGEVAQLLDDTLDDVRILERKLIAFAPTLAAAVAADLRLLESGLLAARAELGEVRA